MWAIALWGISLLVIFKRTSADVSFQMEIVDYDSYGNYWDGDCCDGAWFVCGNCDLKLKICIDRRNGDDSLDSCSYYGPYKTQVYENKNKVDLNIRISKVMSSADWENGFKFKAYIVDDDDTNGDDKIDSFNHVIDIPVLPHSVGAEKISGQRRSKPSVFNIKYRAGCAVNYYGPACETYCVAKNNDDDGHYTCDPRTGEIICRPGWEGQSCTVKVDDCEEVICYNGGECRDLYQEYYCQCSPIFTGLHCETEIIPPTTEDPCYIEPVDCVVGHWAPQGRCTVPCGGGVQSYYRKVLTPAVGTGAACPVLEKTELCNPEICNEDCVVSGWRKMGQCSEPCGGGVQVYQRIVLAPASGNGNACPLLEKHELCNVENCPVDCEVSSWRAVGSCSAECWGGEQMHVREVVVYPSGGGAGCPKLYKTEECNTHECQSILFEEGPFGISGGEVFSDADLATSCTDIEKIEVYASDFAINGIAVTYHGGVAPHLFGTPNNMTEISMQPGEYIFSVEIDVDASDIIVGLTLYSSIGQIASVSAGSSDIKETYDITPGPHAGLAYISGSGGSILSQINLHFCSPVKVDYTASSDDLAINV